MDFEKTDFMVDPHIVWGSTYETSASAALLTEIIMKYGKSFKNGNDHPYFGQLIAFAASRSCIKRHEASAMAPK